MRIPLSFCAAAMLAACSNMDPDGAELLGTIQMLPWYPAEVTVPETARAGEPFTVTIITHGGGCIHQGVTRVRREGMTATVRPYDVDDGGDACPPNVATYEHTATLRFSQPGTATVRFEGMGYPEQGVVTVTRTVTIQ